jgi:hypothetical protein
MPGNYLEQLIAEWYEFKGYFVRRNIKVEKRAKGGYDGELDVVAFHPSKKHLVHIEPSLDAYKWAKREERFSKKFAAGRKHIPKIFEGFELPPDIEQIALLVYASKVNHPTVGGGTLVTLDELLEEIFTEIKSLRISSNSIPEDKPILRSFQYVAEFRQNIIRILR